MATTTVLAPETGALKDRVTKLKPSERPLLWTIRNKRYAIPERFVAAHPGGVDAIQLGRGRNCTELFESYHSLTDKPHAMLSKFYVEDAAPGDADYEDSFGWTEKEAPFYQELKSTVRNYFESRQLSHKATWGKLAVVLTSALLTAAVYVWGFLGGLWWAPVVLPWLYWLGPACLLHDGSHFALSSSPLINGLFARIGSLHMGLWAWYHQHVVGHHSYTNMLDRDPDLRAFEGTPPESFYGHRLTPFSPYFRMYRRWFKSLLITMPFSCLQPTIKQDCNVWLFGHYDDTVAVTVRPGLLRTAVHLATRVVLWSSLFVVPFVLFSPLKALFFALWPSACYGIQYYVFSQISHINEDCFHPVVNRDWAAHQIQTSLDWGVHHSFWRYLSVGLNLQTVHHLFPQVDTSHHQQLRPLIERVAAKHGVKMNYAPTLWDALVVHFRHIYAINRAGVNDPVQAAR